MSNGIGTIANGVFPPRDKGGVPNSPQICNGYEPANAVVGDGPLYVSPDCTTTLTDCQMNALASEILAATDRLGYAFNTARVSNLGDALLDRLTIMQADIDRRILRQGDTMEGPLEVICPPANDNDATCKRYIDDELAHEVALLMDRITAEAAIAQACCDTKVSKAGDVMTGPLQLYDDPQALGEAANKNYVDNLIAGINQFVDAPADGEYYLRKDHAWEILPGGAEGITITISPTPPANPHHGDLWWENVVGQLYIYYNDGDSSQWVAAAPAIGSEGLFLPISGGIITGNLQINGATFAVGPVFSTAPIGGGNQLVTADWVEQNYLSTAGGIVHGNVSINADLGIAGDLSVEGIAQSNAPITQPFQFITKSYLEDAIANIGAGTDGGVTEQWVEDHFLPIAGGTITGNLLVNGFAGTGGHPLNVTEPFQFTTKAYVDSLIPNVSNYLPLTGGTVTGNLQINGSATSLAAITQPLQLATKQYVDNVALGGIDTSQFFRITGGTIAGNTAIIGNLSVSGQATTTAAITQPLQFATKQYVDNQILLSGGLTDSPHDGEVYARQSGAWVPISGITNMDGGTF